MAASTKAEERQAVLTKPPGSLGRLEEVAIQLAGLQGRERPTLGDIRIVVFAGDHGVYEESVAPYPQSVTVEMVRNFAAGGAAICVLASGLGAPLEVVNVGTVDDPGPLAGVVDGRVGAGTANLALEPAMTEQQLEAALHQGRMAAERAAERGCDLLIGGEMGIANTTSAAALGCALTGSLPSEMVGPGTGLDPAGVRHKSSVVGRALALHADHLANPMEALRRLGGFELAALSGCLAGAAQLRVPLLIDGFIVSVAALAAVQVNPSVRQWLVFGHRSGEPGHTRLLDALDAKPLLDLGMRLGEGSGAAVAAHLLRAAVDLHDRMATFESAQVSQG